MKTCNGKARARATELDRETMKQTRGGSTYSVLKAPELLGRLFKRRRLPAAIVQAPCGHDCG